MWTGGGSSFLARAYQNDLMPKDTFAVADPGDADRPDGGPGIRGVPQAVHQRTDAR